MELVKQCRWSQNSDVVASFWKKEKKARVEKVEMQLDVFVDLEEFTHSLEVQSYDNLNRVVHYLLVN